MATTTAARRRLIRRLVHAHRPARQNELVDLLAHEGYTVTQATVSRDLDALGAAKARDDEGGHYVIPLVPAIETGGGIDLVAEFVDEIAASGNLVVLKTPPGAAHMVAGAIDRSNIEGVLGTVAGDDTILVVAPDGPGSRELAKRFEQMGEV
jgi:transcriptional regulator of arginine metabolism